MRRKSGAREQDYHRGESAVPEENHRVREAVFLRLLESTATEPSRGGQGSRVHLTCLEVSIPRSDGCAAELLPLRAGHHNLVRCLQREPACGGGRGPGLRLVEPLLQVRHKRLRPHGDGTGPVAGPGALTARLVPVRDIQHHRHAEPLRGGHDPEQQRAVPEGRHL